MECLIDAYRRVDSKTWKIGTVGDPGRDGVDRGTGVNQCGGLSLGDLDRDADRGDRFVRGEFLIRFDYDGLFYRLDLDNGYGGMFLASVRAFSGYVPWLTALETDTGLP